MGLMYHDVYDTLESSGYFCEGFIEFQTQVSRRTHFEGLKS